MSSVSRSGDTPEFDAPWYAGKSYQLLVEDGARRVHAGEYALDDLSVHPSQINRPEEEHGECIEELQGDVKAYIDSHSFDDPATESEAERHMTPARTADDIAWARVFDEFNFQYGNQGVSRTQLRGALAVSDHTTFGPDADDAVVGTPETLDSVIEDAVDAGYLMEVRHRVGYIDLVEEIGATKVMR